MPKVPSRRQFDALAEVVDSLTATVDSLEGVVESHQARLEALEGTNEPPPSLARFPGDPGTTKAYWGASIENNGDPVKHEGPSGEVLAIRRTFFSGWSQRAALVNMATLDLMDGRLPWVSIKTPSWAEMAAGQHDAAIDALLGDLRTLNDPVWLTFWHEPGNDHSSQGPASDHLAMNKRVRQRMTALGIQNVALCIVYIAGTFEKRDPEDYWEDGVYDIIGVDIYRPDGGSILKSRYLPKIEAFAAAKNTPYAFAEFGLKDGPTPIAERVREVWDYCLAKPEMVAACYYDSRGGSRGPWDLRGEALTEFQAIMSDERVARLSGGAG